MITKLHTLTIEGLTILITGTVWGFDLDTANKEMDLIVKGMTVVAIALLIVMRLMKIKKKKDEN